MAGSPGGAEPLIDWREVPLGEATEISWGDTSTTKASYSPTGWPAYSASGHDGFLPHFDHEEDAVVISAIGAQCGKTWLARGRWSCIKNTMWMRARPGEADTTFLFYATRRSDFWPRRGAAQPFISLGDAKSTLLYIPPVATQRHIAAVLTAFDELIEINDRRIELLENLAHSLYREWFVRFRFPGHEKTIFRRSELGSIPQGWDVRRLGDIAELCYGKSLPARKRRAGRYPVVSSAGVVDQHDEAVVAGPGIVIGRKGNVGAVWWVNEDFFPIDTTYYLRTELPLGLLYWQLLDLQFDDSHAAVPGLSRDHASALPVIHSDVNLASRFGEIHTAWFDSIAHLERQNRSLAATRDLLLPRLVTGRLDISDIDLGDLLPAEPA